MCREMSFQEFVLSAQSNGFGAALRLRNILGYRAQFRLSRSTERKRRGSWHDLDADRVWPAGDYVGPLTIEVRLHDKSVVSHDINVAENGILSHADQACLAGASA